MLRDFIPALKWGAKISSNDIAGLLGLPYVGNIYYVDPSGGNDTTNSGENFTNALKTVSAAYAKCTSGQHDVVLIVPSGGTGRTTEPAAIAWAKRFTHLIGCSAPTATSIRSGMSFTLAAATTTPQFVLSENGCIFKNITFYQGVATSYVMASITGDYNYFENCHFAGLSDATAAAEANGVVLLLNGAEENRFVGCTFGNDNVARSAANTLIDFQGGSSKTVFDGCRFLTYATAATAIDVRADTVNDIGRFVDFNGCAFINYVDGTSLAQTVKMTLNAAPGGVVILRGGTVMTGATDWASAFNQLKVEPVYASNTTGILTTAT